MRPRAKKLSTADEPNRQSAKGDPDPYAEYFLEQEKREWEWSVNRESKRSKEEQTPPALVTSSSVSPSQQAPQQDDVITVLRHQLTAKTEECRNLTKRLDAMEEANLKIISCQMQLQDNFVKVTTLSQLPFPEIKDNLQILVK